MLIFKRKSLVLLCINLIKNTEQFEILLFSFFLKYCTFINVIACLQCHMIFQKLCVCVCVCVIVV